MRLHIHSEDLPRELRELMVHQRVSITLTFTVGEMMLDAAEGVHESVGGQILELEVDRVTGGGGLNATVESGINVLRKLRVRTMGTNG